MMLVGERTPAELTDRMRRAGLVDVTGLPMWDFCQFDQEPSVKEGWEVKASDLGRYDSNNGVYAFVLMNGRMYIGCSTDEAGVITERRALAEDQDLFPNGRGLWVKASNAEDPHPIHLLQRIADPYAHPKGY